MRDFPCQLLIRPEGLLLVLCQDCSEQHMAGVFETSHKRKDAADFGKEFEDTTSTDLIVHSDVFAQAKTLYTMEARSIGISAEQQKVELQELLEDIKKQCYEAEMDDGVTSVTVWDNEFFYKHESWPPQRINKGKAPMTPSVGAVLPVIVRKDGGRIHVAGNIKILPVRTLLLRRESINTCISDVMQWFMNALQWIQPMHSLRVMWGFQQPGNDYGTDGRKELIRYAEHYHVIQERIPYRREDRFRMQMTPDEAASFHREMRTGVANKQTCYNSEQPYWKVKGLYSRGSLRYTSKEDRLTGLTWFKVFLASLRSEKDFEERMLPNEGKEPYAAPYLAEIGPVPVEYSFGWMFHFMSKRLLILTTRCNKAWHTEFDTAKLCAYACGLVFLRRAKRCPSRLQEVFGLPLSYYANSSFSMSFGHVEHGRPMTIALRNKDGKIESLADIDFDNSNLTIETWGSNIARGSANNLIPQIQDRWRSQPLGSEIFPEALPPILSHWDPRELANRKGDMFEDDDAFEGDRLMQSTQQVLGRLDKALGRDEQDITAGRPARHATKQEKTAAKPKVKPAVKTLGAETALTLEKRGIIGSGRVNMDNGNNFCWATTVMQTISSFPSIRSVVLSDLPFPRNPDSIGISDHLLNDPEIRKLPQDQRRAARVKRLNSLYPVIADLFRDLHRSGEKLLAGRSYLLNDALAQYDPQWRAGGMDDPGNLFFNVFSMIFFGSDSSTASGSARLATDVFREELEALEKAGGILPFAEHLQRTEQATRQCGHSTALFDQFFMCWCHEGRCRTEECLHVSRAIEHHPTMELTLPQLSPIELHDKSKLKSYDLNQLIDKYATSHIMDEANKAHCKIDKTHLGYVTAPRRLLKLPENLVIKISRAQYNVNAKDYTEVNQHNVENPVRIPTSLDMSPYMDVVLPSDPDCLLQIDPEKSKQFELVAVIANKPAARHFVAYIDTNRIEDVTRAPAWKLFDSMLQRPLDSNDPTEELNQPRAEMIAYMVFYKRADKKKARPGSRTMVVEKSPPRHKDFGDIMDVEHAYDPAKPPSKKDIRPEPKTKGESKLPRPVAKPAPEAASKATTKSRPTSPVKPRPGSPSKSRPASPIKLAAAKGTSIPKAARPSAFDEPATKISLYKDSGTHPIMTPAVKHVLSKSAPPPTDKATADQLANMNSRLTITERNTDQILENFAQLTEQLARAERLRDLQVKAEQQKSLAAFRPIVMGMSETLKRFDQLAARAGPEAARTFADALAPALQGLAETADFLPRPATLPDDSHEAAVEGAVSPFAAGKKTLTAVGTPAGAGGAAPGTTIGATPRGGGSRGRGFGLDVTPSLAARRGRSSHVRVRGAARTKIFDSESDEEDDIA